jgi:hypothetical protein
MTNHKPTQEEWCERVQQAEEKNEPDRMMRLVQQLISKFDEGKRKGPRSVDLK